MREKHTEGPWHTENDSDYTVECHRIIDSNNEEVLLSFENASLMAAAPEMLVALKAALTALNKSCWCGEHPPESGECAACSAWSQVKEAIDKSKGELSSESKEA